MTTSKFVIGLAIAMLLQGSVFAVQYRDLLYFRQPVAAILRDDPTTFESNARTVGEIVHELRIGRFSNIAERSGRAQDAADGGGLETLRKDGYM